MRWDAMVRSTAITRQTDHIILYKPSSFQGNCEEMKTNKHSGRSFEQNRLFEFNDLSLLLNLKTPAQLARPSA